MPSPTLRWLSAHLLLLVGYTSAWAPPTYTGYTLIWEDTFDGDANVLPDSSKWNVIDEDLGYNGELETYTNSDSNVQLSGGATLQLIPEYCGDSDCTEWTSGRIESIYTFTPTSGLITRAESQLRFGNNTEEHKQGVWPAFWLLGQSGREGTTWPECGELDIMEELNGEYLAYGTCHCGTACDSGDLNGYQKSVDIPDYSWHTWRLEWDRTSGDWETETITWYIDGTNFNQISGSELGVEDQWAALCHSPLYILFNVAIGGTWPGYPNSDTWLGAESMMEVAYVAIFQSD
ncbi:putative endo-1,3(4)-beta-glucanase [Xylariales sp. PMI_506]|nr:putative endo-1,3(4)-beta-glucanase [Xylariales sp. PMI_506]